MKRQAWISDSSNKRVKQIKESFQASLTEQAKQSRINYYDFLLVAKKLAFRFEQSAHLMAVKNFFSKNKNSILIKKLVDSLCINQQSLNTKDDKIIVKFSVPDNDFAPIKEVTNQDEDEYYETNSEDYAADDSKYLGMGSSLTQEQSQEINEKMTIILSIKMEEMDKKIKLLTNQFHYPNIFTVFDEHPHEAISYEVFRAGILVIIADIKDKIRISEDDIKTLFFVLDEGEKQTLSIEDIQKLRNVEDIAGRLKNFYYSRINRDMVKNTLFKLGRVKNSSIQIYQLKNASVLEFQQLEEQIVNEPIKYSVKKRLPHFGPLKVTRDRRSEKNFTSTDTKLVTLQSAHYSANKGNQLNKERERIEKILRSSKEEKKREKNGETVASKLRSLFIHKVILPREKMLEEEKMKYGRSRQGEQQLAIRPLKQTR